MNKKLLILIIAFIVLAAGGIWLTRDGGSGLPLGGASVPEGWVQAVGDGISFWYPESLDYSSIGTTVWPPQGFLLGESPLECGETAQAGEAVKRVVNGNTYCVTEQSDGSTGSTFTQYAYAFEKGDKVVALLFGLRFLQCEKYEGERKIACETERSAFDIDPLADQIAQTLELDKIEDAPDTSVVPEGV